MSERTMSEHQEPSCNLILELLPEAIAGDLDHESELIVSRHVSQCHRCGREWKAFFEAHDALRTLRGSEVEPDASFFDGLRTDILGEIQHQAQELADARALQAARGFAVEPPIRRLPLRVTAFAATLLLGVLLGTFIGPRAPQIGEGDFADRGTDAGTRLERQSVRSVREGGSKRVPVVPDVTSDDLDDLVDYIKLVRDLDTRTVGEQQRERSQESQDY